MVIKVEWDTLRHIYTGKNKFHHTQNIMNFIFKTNDIKAFTINLPPTYKFNKLTNA